MEQKMILSPDSIKNRTWSDDELDILKYSKGPCGAAAISILTGTSLLISAEFLGTNGVSNYKMTRALLGKQTAMYGYPAEYIRTNSVYLCVYQENHWIIVDTRDGFFARDAHRHYSESEIKNSIIACFEVFDLSADFDDNYAGLLQLNSPYLIGWEQAKEIGELQTQIAKEQTSKALPFMAGLVTGLTVMSTIFLMVFL
jgi:hypothetical protein